MLVSAQGPPLSRSQTGRKYPTGGQPISWYGHIGMLSFVVQYTHASAIPTKADDGQASGKRKP